MKSRKLKDAFLVLSTFISAIAALIVLSHQISFVTVTSESMSPAIKAGDIVMTKQIKSMDIQDRDILILPLPENRSFLYAHRVVLKEEKSQYIRIQTKGDANPNIDNWTLEITSETVPKVLLVLPFSSVLSGVVGRETVFLFFVGAGLLMLILGVWQVSRKVSR